MSSKQVSAGRVFSFINKPFVKIDVLEEILEFFTYVTHFSRSLLSKGSPPTNLKTVQLTNLDKLSMSLLNSSVV